MKRTLFSIFAFISIISFSFGAGPKDPKPTLTTNPDGSVTFSGKTYTPEFAEEFDNEDSFYETWVSPEWTGEEKFEMLSDNGLIQNYFNEPKGTNKTFYSVTNPKGSFVLDGGVLHMFPFTSKRTAENNKNKFIFEQTRTQLRSGTWKVEVPVTKKEIAADVQDVTEPVEVESIHEEEALEQSLENAADAEVEVEEFVDDTVVEESDNVKKETQQLVISKSPFYFKTGVYIECKFRMPRAPGYSLAIYAMQKEKTEPYSLPLNDNEKGYDIHKVDFCEISSNGEYIKNKKQIVPRGGVEVSHYGSKVDANTDNPFSWDIWGTPYAIDGEKWFSEWHTLQIVFENSRLLCYLDGKQYRYMKWSKNMGPIPEDQEYYLVLSPEAQPSNFRAPFDLSNTEPYDFQFDYIKVYKEAE